MDGKGNRGWGAIVESTDYALFMKNIFLNDFDKSYGDVHDFNDLKTVSGKTLTYVAPTSLYDTTSYSCTVTPVVSPDSSWDATIYYIDESDFRVYAENQSLTNSYSDMSTESPIKHMAERAKDNVDVRFILNSDTDTEDAIRNVENINTSSYIKAATMKKPYVHNKGLIGDDTSFVSSVNWTATSLTSNRESCVAIHSKEISDYFASFFEADFARNYSYKGLTVKISELQSTYDEAGTITVTADVEQEGTFSYEWNLDGVKKTTDVKRTTFEVKDGSHTLTVTVTDSENNTGYATADFKVGKSTPSDETSDKSFNLQEIVEKIKPYIIPIIVIIIGLFAAIIKSSTGKKKKKKGGKKR